MTSNDTRDHLVERTTLRTVLTAIIVVITGLLLIIIAEINGLWLWINNGNIQTVIQSVLRDIGSLLLASVAISLLWELTGKRAFFDEVLPIMRLSQDVRLAGIIRITPSFQRDIDWDLLFRNVKELDIFFLYGQTWRRTHTEQLHEAALRQVKIRVVLPDPDDNIVMSELARRMDRKEERVRESILEAVMELKKLEQEGANVSIWFLPRLPLFSFYRFDHNIILSLYTNTQNTVPAFLLEEGGSLYNFARAEFSAMTRENGLARPA